MIPSLNAELRDSDNDESWEREDPHTTSRTSGEAERIKSSVDGATTFSYVGPFSARYGGEPQATLPNITTEEAP